MTRERIALHREQETMLMTLYLRARDAARPTPILGDTFAGPLLERIDYDFTRFAKLDGNRPAIAVRARAIDDQARGFLVDHPDAVVLHLGCGLDSRVQRLAPGPGVAWFDVDQAPVIDLRRRLVPEIPGVTTVAASVTDPQWWADVPTGRPTLVIGEGLLMYLDPDGVDTVVDAALRVGGGSAQLLVFDTISPWVSRASRWQPYFRQADIRFHSTTGDLAAAIGRHRRVRLVGQRSVVALTGQAGSGATAVIAKLMAAVGPGRRAMVIRAYQTEPRPRD